MIIESIKLNACRPAKLILKVEAGARVDEVYKEAILLAMHLDIPVSFRFNEKEFGIDPKFILTTFLAI